MTLPRLTLVPVIYITGGAFRAPMTHSDHPNGKAQQPDNLGVQAVLVRRPRVAFVPRIFYIVPHIINGVFTVGLRPVKPLRRPAMLNRYTMVPRSLGSPRYGACSLASVQLRRIVAQVKQRCTDCQPDSGPFVSSLFFL